METKQPSASPIKLNRVLTFVDLMAIAVGLIIGAGIITLTGIAIGMTGRAVSLAFIAAAVIIALTNIPFAIVGGTLRLEGGQYTHLAMFSGKFLTGFSLYTQFFAIIALGMLGISFAQYLMELVPGLPVVPAAIAVITLVFLLNFFGIKGVAKLQIAMVLVMIVALTLYAVFGLGRVAPDYMKAPGFFRGGTGGFLVAVALLTFATDGAKSIINLSGESKNPTRDIPRVMTISTLAVGVLYGLIGVVASGVLPVDQVMDKPLALVAFEVLPYPVYIFFMLGGALFSLLTTLNATVGYMTKPLITACEDGWLPRRFAALHPRFKSPYYLLIVGYVVAIAPVLLRLDIDTIANSTIILLRFSVLFCCVTTVRFPKRYPEIWARSPRKIKTGSLWFICMLTGVLTLFQIVALAIDTDLPALIGNGILMALAAALALWRRNKVTLSISYEEVKGV